MFQKKISLKFGKEELGFPALFPNETLGISHLKF